MANEQLFREYKLSDSELTMFTQHICDCITRDIDEFAAFNVLPANVTALQALCDAFEIFPTDEFIYEEYLSQTEVKDNLISEIKGMMRNIALRAELKWGKSSVKYKSLGIADMSKLGDDAFTTRARMLWAFADKNKVELASEGLTQDMLDDLNDKIQELDDARREQIEKASYRVEKTTERITKGNELYNLVSRYCEIGKRIWDGVNPAFFNDYVIYKDATPGSLAAPQNLIFNYSAKVLWWDTVENAVSYQLQWWDGSDYVEIYAGGLDNFAFTPPDGLNKFRVRGHNSGGYGPWSEILEQYYYGTLPKAANLQVVQSSFVPTEGELTWDAVPTAFNYKVYQSVDNIGEYAAHWLVIGTVTEPLKSVTLTLGKRNSFKVETNNTYQTSMSDPIFIEV